MSATLRRKAALAGLRLLPKNYLSSLAGKVASRRVPQPILTTAIKAFGRAYDVNFSEMTHGLDEYRSFQEFFSRSIKDECRPIDSDPTVLLSPCDGRWGAAGAIDGGLCLQAKGRSYPLADLLQDSHLASSLEGGEFANFYLSPGDYHRFHAPADVTVHSLRHVPGALWPVNSLGVEQIDGLFATNERLVISMSPVAGQGRIVVVAIGATMVGRVKVVFDSLSTNSGARQSTLQGYSDPAPKLSRGVELGRFEFGSTIILLVSSGLANFSIQDVGSIVRVRSCVGKLAIQSGVFAEHLQRPR